MQKTYRSSFHCEGFARARLTVGKDANVVAICTTLSQLRYFLEYLGLAALRLKDLDDALFYKK